jgi:CotS family spore coat protein
MKEIVTAISLLYSIHIKRIVSLKAQKVWQIVADEGLFILKLLPFPREETDFITEAMSYLGQNGFHRYNEIVYTKENMPYGAYGESSTLLTKQLYGRIPSYKIEKDVTAVAVCLGELHQANRGFSPKHRFEQRIKWGKMIETINAGKEDLLEFTAMLEKKAEKDDFDKAFLSYCHFYIQQTQEVITELKTFYPSLSSIKEKNGGFCHHDPAHHNFLIDEIDEKEQVFLFDFDYVIADLRAHDVAALLLKILKTNHWNTLLGQKAFSAYHEVFPLDREEIHFIKMLLKYPYDFRQAAFARYAEKDGSARIAKKLPRLTREAELRETALLTLNQYFAEES